MTRKSPSAKSPMEELDLDSFLRRHNAGSGEDSDDSDDHLTAGVPHRTVDDILNDSDSSSSSPPSSRFSLSSFKDDDPPKTLIPTYKPSVSTQSKHNLIQRFKSDEFAGRKPPLRPSSSLFSGGVRPAARPGTALAAAAAASRSIKSRRALSVSDELLGFSRDDLSDRIRVSDQVDVKLEVGNGDYVHQRVEESIQERDNGLQNDYVSNVDELSNEKSAISMSDELIQERDSDFVESNDYASEVVFSNEDPSTSNSNVDELSNEKSAISMSDELESKEDEHFPDMGVGSSLEVENGKIEAILESELSVAKDDVSSSISDDDDVDVDEIVEDRIAQLESEIATRMMTEKKVEPLKKPLELAEELEIKQASTGLHLEEGAAAQPMRLEGVRRGSTVLGYFDTDADNMITRTIKSQTFRRDYGIPQVLNVHLNYIAFGTLKGVIVVLPCKYSPHHPDNMDAKILMLGAQGDRSQVPVTSICFNQQGDLLLAGYGDGRITVWNIPRGTVAKVISGEHKAPVVHALFLGQDSQVTRQFKAVTGDGKGLVKLHEFSGMPFLGFTVKTQCLLDGQQTGTVICASPLLPDECTGAASVTYQGNATGSGSIGGMMGGVVGGAAGWKLFSEGSSLSEEGVVIFVTHQSALVVRLSPSLEVYASLPKPEGVREGAMPYTAWKCTTQTCGSSTENRNPDTLEKISLLAIAWDRRIQVAKLVKSELKVCGKWTLESSAIGLAWLDDQMLVILTLAGQLCLFTKEGTLIHQTSYALDGYGGDDLIAYHTYFTNVFGNPEKAYHNSIAVRGASVYILGPMHAIVSRLLPWKERIQVLRKAGDWMGALNMAMTLYDGQAHGVIDLPRNLHAVQEAIMPYLVELLFSYVDESFSYISVACFNQTEKVEESDSSKSNSCVKTEIKEQFTRVGGVAVEFCIHIKRTDILFDDIFSKFVAVEHKDAFLELLEPYILKDMLGSLPPEIMQALVEHYNSKGWLQRVEQCVLHMDISSLDFNQVVRLCRENGLYGALIYLFNKGLDDFKTPLEELLSVLRNNEKDAAAAANVGYRMLVYLKYCFSGLAFPPGHGTLPSERLPSLRMELVQFLLEESGGPKSQTAASLTSTGAYLNLHYLLELDTEATLDVLRISFREYGNFKPESSVLDSSDQTTDNAKEKDSSTENQDMMVQKTVDALVLILDVNISQSIRSAGTDDTGLQVWPSKKDIGHLIEFIASYVASRRANVSKSVLSQIMEYLISDHYLLPSDSEEKNESRKRREKKVLALLDAVPHTEWNPSYVLHLCEDVQFYKVCGLIHTIRHQYLAALDSYIKDVNEPVHAFSFIHSMLLQLSGTESAAFRSAVISRISELFHLSRECTFYLVIDHFNKEHGHILSELRSKPQSLFLYLKTLVEVHLSGTLNFSCVRTDNIVDVPCGGRVKDGQTSLEAYSERISEFPKVLRNNPVEVTDDMIELYLELLCQYDPDSVLKFLDTFENYRVDRCLQLCQEYGIVDAAAYLQERVGDVGTALLLTLSSINDKFIMLDTAVGSMVSARAGRKTAHVDYLAAASGLKEVQDIRKILRACVGLCQRNTPRLDPEESESLWFHLLDSFCKPLIIPDQNSQTGVFAPSVSSKDDQEVNAVTWRVSGSHKHAPVLKGLFSQFVKEIVEGMIGYVRLPSIMEKLLSDNGSREFGDFKLTILGMLGTYGFEMRILDTARSLIEDDTYYTMSVLKKGASKGYAPRSLVCCVCNCPFNKSSSSSGIRLFNCGHTTHLQCDTQENSTSSHSSSGGCPICVHKQKIQKTKGKMAEQGLVSTAPSRSTRAHATSIHQHELDPFENSASHHISRFEILNSLQKNQRLIQTDTMPQLRLAPPAVYHEKVNKRSHLSSGSSSGGLMDAEKHSKNRQLRDLKVKGSSIRFPLKSKIFGKEKTRLQ